MKGIVEIKECEGANKNAHFPYIRYVLSCIEKILASVTHFEDDYNLYNDETQYFLLTILLDTGIDAVSFLEEVEEKTYLSTADIIDAQYAGDFVFYLRCLRNAILYVYKID